MEKIQIITTSCTRRELEIEQMRTYFLRNGYAVSENDFDTDLDADYIILSTCGFTQAAEDFALKTLERIENEKNLAVKYLLEDVCLKLTALWFKDIQHLIRVVMISWMIFPCKTQVL